MIEDLIKFTLIMIVVGIPALYVNHFGILMLYYISLIGLIIKAYEVDRIGKNRRDK